jgi:UDP-galactopyranose mutase
MKYDYLIVGAGLFGSVFAFEATKRGKKCLIVDRRSHIGGNVYCEDVDGINVHKYGCHIFHTNDRGIWDYINQFTEFNNYIASPIAIYDGRAFNLPFNMNTFARIWEITTPTEAQAIIERQALKIPNPKNLEEQALSTVGRDIYERLIRGYVIKQWGKDPKDLPAEILKRLPVRFTYDNNYFNHRYQGIPIKGYNHIISEMLKGSDVVLNCDFLKSKDELVAKADKIIYTGMIDEYYDYCYGALEYRSLQFEEERIEIENYQGNAIVSHTDVRVPFTRIIEHKHFEFGTQPHTVITKEYSLTWTKGMEPFYPINDKPNNLLYNKYKELNNDSKVIFGGRLGSYKYYDMDQVIAASLTLVKKELE